jgi:hypothetical protein
MTLHSLRDGYARPKFPSALNLRAADKAVERAIELGDVAETARQRRARHYVCLPRREPGAGTTPPDLHVTNPR